MIRAGTTSKGKNAHTSRHHWHPAGRTGRALVHRTQTAFPMHIPTTKSYFFSPTASKLLIFFSPPCWVRAETPSSLPATLKGGDHIGDASHMQQDTTLPTCLQSTLIVYFHLSKTSARLGLKKGWEGGKPSESWAACWSPKGLKLGMGGGASSPFQRSFQ